MQTEMNLNDINQIAIVNSKSPRNKKSGKQKTS